MQKELDKFTNQARFVQMIIDGKLTVAKKAKATLMQELKEKAFKPIPKAADPAKQGETEEVAESSDDEEPALGSDSYDYLLGMAIWSLTKERVEKLRQQIGDKELEIDALIKLSKEEIWRNDLDGFLEEWRYQLDDDEKREKKIRSMGRRVSNKLKIGGRAAGKKRKADDDDSDFAVPKPKKATKASAKATINKVQPKGGLMDYLTKASPKGKSKGKGFDGASDMDEDISESEVAPQRKPRAAAKKPVINDFSFTDSEDDLKPIVPKAAPPAKKDSPPIDEVLSELEDAPPLQVEAAPTQELSELDDASEEEVVPKKTSRARAAPNAAPKKAESPIDILSDDGLEEEIIPKKTSRSRAAPKVAPTQDDESEEEVVPQKTARSRAAPKVAPTRAESPIDILSDDDLEEEVLPKKTSRSRAAPTQDDESEEEVAPQKTARSRAAPKAAPKKAESPIDILSDDDLEEEVLPKKPARSRAAPAKPAAKTAKSKPASKETDESDFDDVVSKPASRRAARKPVKYDDALESDSDDDDQLGDVSQMVKGIGGSGGSMDDSRALFAETSRIGSGAGSRAATKAKKGAIQDDETDYSKLIPSKSPRPSLTVKPKDVKPVDDDEDKDEDEDNDEEEPVAPVKSTAKGKAAAKPAAKTTKATAASKAKKPAATKAAPKTKQTTLQLSPAAKAYASKKAKADNDKGKTLADDFSDGEDDIDAMVDDILDSPPATKKTAPASSSARPSRRAATTKKKTYTVNEDSEEESDFGAGGGEESEDEFYDFE